MTPSLRYGLQHTQKLTLSQSQIQGIELLQLSNIELYERMSQEMLDNPVIEEGLQVKDDPVPVPESDDSAREDRAVVNLEEPGQVREEEYNTREDELPSDAVRGHGDLQRRNYLESAVADRETLKEHLLWQARMSAECGGDLSVYEAIITSLDERGFLSRDVPQYAEEQGISEEKVAEVVTALRHFDPVGCAVSDVQESIEVQVAHFFPDDLVLARMVREHFRDMEQLDYDRIAKSLHIPVQKVMEKSHCVQGLDPYPGSRFATGSIIYVIPDIDVKLMGGEIIISMNDDWIPRISINPYYLSFLNKKNIEKNLKEYIQGKVQSAKNLVRNISSRRETILKVVAVIMAHQRDFLEKGPGHLRPLTHIDVARETGLHESTVSRVTSNKYVQTSWGIHDLKYFFVSKIRSAEGEASADYVMKRITEIVREEDHGNPHSDEAIVSILSSEGIQIARRTVAKYRDLCNIPSSSRRKRINRLKTEENL
ncbi:MAG: RNA polymerase factor sigma-54 [Spirochaetes bacterium]|nr:RNA polymerase factor sigma-54 [Spirochaetota bacterium]